jgi:hypothetical protein
MAHPPATHPGNDAVAASDPVVVKNRRRDTRIFFLFIAYLFRVGLLYLDYCASLLPVISLTIA